jgi:hypothetical protein
MKNTLALLCVALLLTSCNLITGSSEPSPNFTYTSENGIDYSLTIPKNNYTPGDTLIISFRLKNKTTAEKNFNFYNVEQLGFQLNHKRDNSFIIYPAAFRPALSKISIAPGEEKILELIWNFRNGEGELINFGGYILNVFLLDNNSPKLKLEITFNS